MNGYTLVYDYFETPNDFGNEGILISLAGIIALIAVLIFMKKNKKFPVIFLSIYTTLSLAWNVLVQVQHYKAYHETLDLYNAKKFKTVEGEVFGYSPMDKGGHGSREIFFVDSVFFAYSDYIATDGYNNSCVLGGKICSNGQIVRIQYIERFKMINDIIRLEIKE